MSKILYNSNDIEVVQQGDEIIISYTNSKGFRLHKTYPVSEKQVVLEHLVDIIEDMRRALD